jgi:hypothetical protein
MSHRDVKNGTQNRHSRENVIHPSGAITGIGVIPITDHTKVHLLQLQERRLSEDLCDLVPLHRLDRVEYNSEVNRFQIEGSDLR